MFNPNADFQVGKSLHREYESLHAHPANRSKLNLPKRVFLTATTLLGMGFLALQAIAIFA